MGLFENFDNWSKDLPPSREYNLFKKKIIIVTLILLNVCRDKKKLGNFGLFGQNLLHPALHLFMIL